MKFQTLSLMSSVALLALSTPAFAELSKPEAKMAATVDAEYERSIALLERMVNQNSGTMNFAGVKTVGDMMRAELEPLGFKVAWLDMAKAGRSGHLVATKTGKKGAKKLLLIAHLDTVFEADSPFQKFVRNGQPAHCAHIDQRVYSLAAHFRFGCTHQLRRCVAQQYNIRGMIRMEPVDITLTNSGGGTQQANDTGSAGFSSRFNGWYCANHRHIKRSADVGQRDSASRIASDRDEARTVTLNEAAKQSRNACSDFCLGFCAIGQSCIVRCKDDGCIWKRRSYSAKH